MRLKKYLLVASVAAIAIAACATKSVDDSGDGINKDKRFITISGPNLIAPNGEKFFIRGTNLGNWLNPEGYMFNFSKTNSAGAIDLMFRQLVGPDFTAEFWKAFKDNYVTEADIDFIASTGANTIRVPFHYKLFTDEDYMGLTANQDGFERIDQLVEWCRGKGIYLILDMHDAPGGQTGDNIDDSYGYPWLFESKASQDLFCDIWRRIADHYKNEPVILGYDLLNEPIAPYFENQAELDAKLAGIYKMGVDAVRSVDKNHIILLGGAQWNGNFAPLENTLFDEGIMYTCHRYGGATDANAIRSFIEFRDRVNRPMYMGEIGHNTDEWMAAFCKTMVDNNIGYTFWPYKKIDNSCFAGVPAPYGWNETVVAFSEADRSTYWGIRESRPNQEDARRMMMEFVENSKFDNCVIQYGYIRAIGLHAQGY